jgi:hypothetical protein
VAIRLVVDKDDSKGRPFIAYEEKDSSYDDTFIAFHGGYYSGEQCENCGNIVIDGWRSDKHYICSKCVEEVN